MGGGGGGGCWESGGGGRSRFGQRTERLTRATKELPRGARGGSREKVEPFSHK